MDFTPLHPKIVHIPLALAIILPILNASLTLSWWRQWLPRRVWIISAVLHAMMTLSAFVAMQTGETDEHTAEQVVSKHEIHEHEEAAEVFLYGTVLALLCALIAAIAEKEKIGLRFAMASSILALLCSFLAIEAGNHGGKLVYKYGAGRAFSPAKYGGIADLPEAQKSQFKPSKEHDTEQDQDHESDEGH